VRRVVCYEISRPRREWHIEMFDIVTHDGRPDVPRLIGRCAAVPAAPANRLIRIVKQSAMRIRY